jgi:hypothetical protein
MLVLFLNKKNYAGYTKFMKNSHCGKNKLLISKIINNYLTGEVPCSVSMVMQSSLKKSR